jgi:hypothetical protein
MRFPIGIMTSLIFGRIRKQTERARRMQKAALMCESLEGRAAPAHFHGVHQALAAFYGQHHGGDTESKTSSTAAATAASTNARDQALRESTSSPTSTITSASAGSSPTSRTG